MFLDKKSGEENYCNRCGLCCVAMGVTGFPEDLYPNGTKSRDTICHYLETGGDKTSCKLYNSPERPEVCKEYPACEIPKERWELFSDESPKKRMEHIFLTHISRIPSGKEGENAFKFYYNMWKKGYFRDFSFEHFRDERLLSLETDIRNFLYIHFVWDAPSEDIKTIVSDPEWYNSWDVRELLEGRMDTGIPLEIYKDLQIYEDPEKPSRLKAVLLEWQLFDKIQKINERNRVSFPLLASRT